MPPVSAQPGDYSIISVELVVYRDGVVRAIYWLAVNESAPLVALPLLAPAVGNILALDEASGAPLSYEVNATHLAVASLGASLVRVEYESSRLVEEEAGVWTLRVEAPHPFNLTLPAGAVVVYLSGLPLQIRGVDNRTQLALEAGTWEVSYTLPEEVEAALPEPTTTTTQVETTPAATEPTTTPTSFNGTAGQTLIINTTSATLTTTSPSATTPPATTTSTAQSPVSTGKTTTISEPTGPSQPLDLLLLATLAVMGGLMAAFLWRRRPRRVVSPDLLEGLRPDDLEVLRYLAERSGSAWESELRDRFLLPKTSMWRLVRRLERRGLVHVRRVGGQNLVELSGALDPSKLDRLRGSGRGAPP